MGAGDGRRSAVVFASRRAAVLGKCQLRIARSERNCRARRPAIRIRKPAPARDYQHPENPTYALGPGATRGRALQPPLAPDVDVV